MLVLSRKPQQTIVLSNGATFKVLGITRGRVQVGVSAPADVRILRGECVDAAAIVAEQSALDLIVSTRAPAAA